MKRLIAILAMLTMLLGCGCSNTAYKAQNNGTDNTVTDNNGTTGSNGTTDQNGSGAVNDNNTVGDDIRDGVNDVGNAVGEAGNAVRDGVDNVGDALTGNENRMDNGTAGNNADTNTNTANP